MLRPGSAAQNREQERPYSRQQPVSFIEDGLHAIRPYLLQYYCKWKNLIHRLALGATVQSSFPASANPYALVGGGRICGRELFRTFSVAV